jgi:hypothetical protein
MKKLQHAGVLTVLAVILVFSGCHPTQECGTWVFTGGPSGNSYPMSAAFTFNPANCGKDCNVQTDCIIQMVSVYDFDDGTYMYASDQTGAPLRATDYGWTIDRIDGYAHGYYGLMNDGTFYAGWNTTGANSVATTLFDQPGGWPPNTLFYAFDAAVSFSSQTCNDRILGYYLWSWESDASGTVHDFIHAPAWKDLDITFQNALAGWNAWAPTSPVQSPGGGQPSLPHAIAFPALTDL